MPSELLLKATSELLDGWGGPTLYDPERWGRGDGLEAAVLLWVVADNVPPAAFVQNLKRNQRDAVPVHRVYLDLARAECCARTLRVLAKAVGDDGEAEAYWLHYCDNEGIWSLRRPDNGTTVVAEWDTIERPEDNERIDFLGPGPPAYKALWLADVEPHDTKAALLAIAKQVLH